MIKMLQKLFKEPLIHFLILGGFIYIYYDSVSTTTVDTRQVLFLSKSEQQKIKSKYKEVHKKDINQVLFETLVKENLYDKVLLSEAYRLDLDKNDPFIVNRLLKEMKFILLNSAKLEEPSEELLLKYYTNHIYDYSKIKTLTFYGVYFKDAKDKEIEITYTLLNRFDVNASYAKFFGDVDKELNFTKDQNFNEIKDKYGRYFANKVFALKEGMWSKPIHSKYGIHIVYIIKKDIAEAYPFDDVQDRVYKDFLEDNRTKIIKKAYKDILNSYKLEVE